MTRHTWFRDPPTGPCSRPFGRCRDNNIVIASNRRHVIHRSDRANRVMEAALAVEVATPDLVGFR
jgi:hypothetical protein